MYDAQKNGELSDYLQTLHWSAFFTATFAVRERYSATAMEKVASTLAGVPRIQPQKIFICAEQHLLGGWHCHGLLEYPETRQGIHYLDDAESRAASFELSRLGFNVVDSLRDLPAAAIYCAKYLTKGDKQGDWCMVGRKKFWTS